MYSIGIKLKKHPKKFRNKKRREPMKEQKSFVGSRYLTLDRGKFYNGAYNFFRAGHSNVVNKIKI